MKFWPRSSGPRPRRARDDPGPRGRRSRRLLPSMKAQVLRAWGGPLALVDLPRPVPLAGEVLVAVRACGVGLTVLNAMEGQMARPETLPRVPGHEITGVVAEVGAGVTAVRPGDRVMA